MNLEVLISCMHQQDDTLIKDSRLTADVLMINQCDREAHQVYPTEKGTAHIWSTRDRGLTRSRNMAIGKSQADICLLCDNDQLFLPDYEERILSAYESLPQADVIIFHLTNRPSSFPRKVFRLRFPQTMKVASSQISFRRQRLAEAGVRFDELLGAGTGNGGEEELKFLLDCQKAGLRIYNVPVEIASYREVESTWNKGFTETFFENRGATTRYILGWGMASAYAVYYLLRKRPLYSKQISTSSACRAIFRGIREDRISRLAKKDKTLV